VKAALKFLPVHSPTTSEILSVVLQHCVYSHLFISVSFVGVKSGTQSALLHTSSDSDSPDLQCLCIIYHCCVQPLFIINYTAGY
jgi:hypothetical protein